MSSINENDLRPWLSELEGSPDDKLKNILKPSS